MGTSAVGVTLAVNESVLIFFNLCQLQILTLTLPRFANEAALSTMMINADMKILWDYANEIVWL